MKAKLNRSDRASVPEHPPVSLCQADRKATVQATEAGAFAGRADGSIRSANARGGVLLALAVAALLAACNSRGQAITEGLPTDGYRSHYPITVEEAPEVLDIPVGSGASGLGTDMRNIIASFGTDAARNATSGVVIMTPSGSANQATARYLSRDIARVLRSAGLAAALVATRSYPVADPAANAPIRLAFNRIKAVSPRCGRWSEDIAPDDEKGDEGAEFGCATQANLAAMIENPNDLITPRAQTPIPAWKRWQAVHDSAKPYALSDKL